MIRRKRIFDDAVKVLKERGDKGIIDYTHELDQLSHALDSPGVLEIQRTLEVQRDAARRIREIGRIIRKALEIEDIE